MGRTSNDDRSDGMNPNNDAYWSNEANHERQTGGADDDEYDAPQVMPILTMGWVEPVPTPRPQRDAGAGPCVIGRAPPQVSGLYLKCVFARDQRERTIKVDSASTEAAMGEALVLWEQGGLAFMALYSKTTLVLEKTQLEDFTVDMATQLASLGDLQELVDTAASHLRSARQGLAVLGGAVDRQRFYRAFETFGTWAAATTALRTELAEKISSLQAGAYPVTEASAPVSAAAGKLYLKAKACSQWVRDFQSGKVTLDALSDAFDRPIPISAINA